MYILAFNGSPRRKGNTAALLQEFCRGAREAGALVEEVFADEVTLKNCKGCLRCNLLQHCAIKDDDWTALSQKVLKADVLIFASPVYFHHFTAALKKILERFRSFMHVQITEQGLAHTPWQQWHKQFVLLICLGSSVDDDAKPMVDLFAFITKIMGSSNRLHSIIATRLAMSNQVRMSKETLEILYQKLHLPVHLAEQDYHRNQLLLKRCYALGKALGLGKTDQLIEF